jgi:hypothetical protein
VRREYIFLMFALCFGVWAIVVDVLIIPPTNSLLSDRGQFSRYRVKEWKGDGKIDILKDKILVYAYIKGNEKFYYIDRTGYFEAALKNIEQGATVELRYSKSFPKVWQRSLQEVRVDGVPVLRYSGAYLIEKQKFIWKFSGIMIGMFLLLSALGSINKPRRK